jgi:hypothetical protein
MISFVKTPDPIKKLFFKKNKREGEKNHLLPFFWHKRFSFLKGVHCYHSMIEPQKEKETNDIKATSIKLFEEADTIDPSEISKLLFRIGLKKEHIDYSSGKKEATVLNAAQLAAIMFALSIRKRHDLQIDSPQPCGAILALDAGLGKTLVSLCCIATAKAAGFGQTLVICPCQVVTTWAGEAIRFFGNLFRVLCICQHDRKWERRTSIRGAGGEFDPTKELVDQSDVVVVSSSAFKCMWHHGKEEDNEAVENKIGTDLNKARYEIMHKTWGVVVIDESHHLRNKKAILPKACVSLEPCKLSLLLSGTPIVNRMEDAWPQLCLCRCSDIPVGKTPTAIVGKKRGKKNAMYNFAMETHIASLVKKHAITIHKEHISTIEDGASKLNPCIVDVRTCIHGNFKPVSSHAYIHALSASFDFFLH